ncbi:UPF0149 family protein [Comamonadaceae bacterium M7527]|nr:UPF0149 family protein [Comamonadaceae bacterium M7527]
MNQPTPFTPDEFDALDHILDDIRTRDDEAPQWEFAEGFMAAVLCARRPIDTREALEVLLGGAEVPGGIAFKDDAQRTAFEGLWHKRLAEIEAQLDADIKALDDEAAYSPEVMDVRGAVATLPEDERAAIAQDDIPSFAQVWALGFMFAVENWPDDWELPRDKESAEFIDEALTRIVALTEDDKGVPVLSMLEDEDGEEGEPSVSQERANAFGEALWAVYDLRKAWRALGPKVAPVQVAATPGRNDPCHCGSGKKYKKCHGV